MSLQEEFARDGYVLRRVLTDAEVADFLRRMEAILDPGKGRTEDGIACSSMQHLGDALESFGQRARQYYIHLLGNPAAIPLLDAYHIPTVIDTVAELLGPDPIINNASIFATNPGVSYRLGWHRDVIQIPEDEIRDELFSPAWGHNSVQINLPLFEEQCLWVVPGSHARPDTPEERAAFAGSRHYAPIDADMPGGIPVRIPAGYALLYNNNLIHRGYNDAMTTPRRTLHMGYHSASRKPTWHFHLLPLAPLQDLAYRAKLPPRIRGMVEEHLVWRERFPCMAATWQPGWPGPVGTLLAR